MTGDALAVHVPVDRRVALAAGRDLPVDTHGAALFADVSGFTPLTERLAREHGPRHGAERLTEELDRVLGVLIDEVHAAGGSVVYFSGDAITVWLDGDDGTRAVACADRMQRAMARVDTVRVGADDVTLGLKVAVAAGAARRFDVGDPGFHRVDVVAGAVLDEVAAAEGRASPGDVVVTRVVFDVLDESRRDGGRVSDDDATVVLAPAAGELPAAPRPVADLPLGDEDAAAWVPRAVRGRLASGDGALVAELRNVVPVFVDLGGIDLRAATGPAVLDEFVTTIQRTMDDHGGSLLTLTVGDKGAYGFGVFGTPIAHEDDPGRAVSAGLAITASADRLGIAGVRVGVSIGRAFSGVQGNERRRTFVCLGDAVNLAARVMGVAGPGEVLATPEVIAELGPGADLDTRPPVALKGKTERVALSVVRGLSSSSLRGAGIDRTPFQGRAADLERVVDLLSEPARRDGGPGAVVVVGSAGIGKSRLVREAVVRFEEQGHRVCYGNARALGGTAAYQPWRAILRELLSVPEVAPPGEQAAAARAAVAEVDPGLLARVPLLSPALGLDMGETALTRGMDPRVAKDSREDLLVRLLARLPGPPRVHVIDDAHQSDQLSLDLVSAIVRSAGLRDAVLLAARPPAEGRVDLSTVPGVGATVELGPLAPEVVELLLDHHATLRLGDPDALHPRVRRAIIDRAQGNPLTVAELLRALVEQDVDPSSPEAAEVELPPSLEALVLGRVDRLPDRTRNVVRIGSVMLRGFSADTLAEVHPELGSIPEIEQAITPAVGELLAALDDDRYDIRHALTREVAYASLPVRLRRRWHTAVAARVQRRYADDLDTQVDVLAHHTWFGESEGRERWTRLAADQAVATYANDAALTHLARLVELVEGEELAETLLARAEVLTLVGRLDDARADQSRALAIAEAAGDDAHRGRALTGLAETARRASDFDEATRLLAEADVVFAGTDDEAGRARVLHLTGTVAAMRGDLDSAGAAYRAALGIRDRLGDDAGRAALMSNLGIVAEYDGNLEAAAARHAEALALRERLGDPWAIANSRTNLGMIALLSGDAATAREHFEAALAGNAEVGDPWHVALGQHNLGNALRDLGEHDAAAARYLEAGTHFDRVDDDWAFAQLLEDAAILAVADGAAEHGAELLGAADATRERLDAPRSAVLAETVVVTLVDATSQAGQDVVDAALARGRASDRARSLGVLVEIATPAR